MDERLWHASYDAGIPAQLDIERLTIPELFERSAEHYSGRTAIVFAGATRSFAELRDDVRRLAAALEGLGVGRDDRVAIQLPNIPQTVIAFYAVLSLGAQAVMTNPLYTVPELEHQWKDADCRVAIVTDYLYDQKLRAHRDQLPVREWIVASIPEYLPFPKNLLAPFKLKKKGLVARIDEDATVHAFRKLVRGTPPRKAPPVPEFDDLAVLQYTGGTTGLSKGAMLTHANLSSNVQQTAAWFSTDFESGGEVMLAALPLFHVFGLTICMNWAISAGATMVLLPDPRDVGALVSCIEKYGVTILPAVPAMFNAINHFKGIQERDLTSVKACFSGSAPLAEDVLLQFESLTGARILEGFGLTETSPVAHVNPLDGVRKVGSIGIPVSNTDARIVDVDSGEPVAGGGEGELELRGPQVMSGYLNRPKETADSLSDGWLKTGDLATMDEDGYFRIVGRKKDMIIASGYNIYPDEVDRVLMSHPAILEAATIGVPHEKRGETVKSFVVLRPGDSLDQDAVAAWCRERLAAYKVPRAVEFIDALPKSTVMKVLRRELREREIAKRQPS